MLTTSLPTASFEGEELSPYLSCEWHYARHLVIYRMKPGFGQQINQHFALMGKIMASWPVEQLYLSIFDYSHPALAYSAELRQAAQRATHARPELRGYTAVLLANTIIGQSIRVYVNSLHGRGGRERKVFFEEALALAWLTLHLPPECRT